MPERRAATRTLVAPADMLASLGSAWRVVFANQPEHSSLLVLLSQWALETGRGKAMVAYNCAGLKASGDQPYASYPTLEVLPRALAERYLQSKTGDEPCEVAADAGGLTVTIRFLPEHPACRFRAYDSLDAGCVDYLRTLYRRFAVAWDFVLAGDPRGFAFALKKAGYFTADVNQYATALASLYSEFARITEETPKPVTLPELQGSAGYDESSRTIVDALAPTNDDET